MMRSRSFVTVCMITSLVLSSLGPGAAAGALDDATILAIFDQANTADIVTGRLGAKYGASEEVRALGKMVATDHVAVLQMGRDIREEAQADAHAARQRYQRGGLRTWWPCCGRRREPTSTRRTCNTK
jgi:hypothetical protein